MFEHENHAITNIPDTHAAITHKIGFLPREALVVVVLDELRQPLWTANHRLADNADFEDVGDSLAHSLSHTERAENVILAVYTSGEDADTRAMTWLMVLQEKVRQHCNVIGMTHFDVDANRWENFTNSGSESGSLDEPRATFPHEPLTISEEDLLVRFEVDEPVTIDPTVKITKDAVTSLVRTNWGLWSDEDVSLLTVAINTRVAARRFFLKVTLDHPLEVVDGWAYMTRKVEDADTRAHFGSLCAVAELLRNEPAQAARALKSTTSGVTHNQLGHMVFQVIQHAYQIPNIPESAKAFFEHQLGQTAEWDDRWDRED